MAKGNRLRQIEPKPKHERIRNKILFYLRFPEGRSASQMIEWLDSCKDMFCEADYKAGRPKPFDEVLGKMRAEGLILYTNGVYSRADLKPKEPVLSTLDTNFGPLFGGT